MQQLHNGDSAKQRLLDQVKSTLQARLDGQELSRLSTFVDVFWSQLVLTDWQHKEVGDIAGCCYSLWLLTASSADHPQVKVINPNLDEHGWLCGGTVIMVRHRDMPFLVDSLRLALNRLSLPVHLLKSTLVRTQRDDRGELVALDSVSSARHEGASWSQEAVIYIETGLIAEASELESLVREVKTVLRDVSLVVNDYHAMLAAVDSLHESLNGAPQKESASEAQAFLTWLKDAHFTFLGCRQYDFVGEGQGRCLQENVDARCGLFSKFDPEPESRTWEELSPGAKVFYRDSALIAFSKSGSRSNVHRAVYPDYIVVKRFDNQGQVIGELRILGLFTYGVYSTSPWAIPIIRKKVEHILHRSGLAPVSHDGKNLLRVLETFPRDELFQSDLDTLFNNTTGVANISERRVVRLFMRTDLFEKFVNCIVYVPRDVYNTQIRLKIEEVIGAAIDSQELDTTTYFSESTLARASLVFRLGDGSKPNYDVEALEAEVVDITRGWQDRFEAALHESMGDAKGLKYFRLYQKAFSYSYQEDFDARTAVQDIQTLEQLSEQQDLAMHFFHPLGRDNSEMRFKVMHLQDRVELSHVIPILENLGLRVLGEHPYQILRSDGSKVWLHDFALTFGLPVHLDVQAVSKLFEQAFAAVWRGEADSDAFNRLVLGARLHWREVAMLRAYAAYMKQTTFTFSQDYIADTLANQLEITRNLVALFKASFDPRINDGQGKGTARIERLNDKILAGLEGVDNLNEDRILRRYYEFINATLRTSFYQKDADGLEKSYLAFKFSPRDLADIPEPKPLFEIFVYSPRMEGVHLRGGKVARGGIRWSDRLQDYRTEVLGLVKAQQVKNAVIVPSGAKGGFVAKHMQAGMTRDQQQAEAIACYQYFIRGLLDLTDNYLNGQPVSPQGVICKDGPDPYLVVAADKGTASFSDIANKISADYGHWLGDAFASGGSQGYDHKKMGITARGAWVCVQRHFRELGLDIQKQNFSVVGIGDMAGDVFGNGMLLSEHICLVAAFNHQHIFIDPTPDPAQSFTERKRLFNLPRSSWGDYNTELLSKGGGVFSRSAKAITITAEMREVLGISADKLAPSELISAILCAPVDLLWNGGIGTYIKASEESHADVGDKANDNLRVNGAELRCRVLGEGGNLGATQLGRVEFAQNGGACNTDFIDNAGGVDCSDHEVNIKILLDEVLAAGDLTEKQRNQLLVDMTEAVAELVLNNNYRQAQALSLAQRQAVERMGEYRRFIHYLENTGRLNRSLEFLPDEEQFAERMGKGQGLTRPELAVLLSYAKVMLKEALVEQDLTEEPYLKKFVASAFPAQLVQQFQSQVFQHRLLREIVATELANAFINSLGITAAHRLLDATNASLKQIVIAFATVQDIFDFEDFRKYLRTLDNQVPEDFQANMMLNMVRRIRRGTRWFLRNRRAGFEPQKEVEFFRPGLHHITETVGEALTGTAHADWAARRFKLEERGLERRWVQQLAMPDNLFSGLSVMEVARLTGHSAEDVAKVFFALYERLNLDWFATQLTEVRIQSHWQAMAREAFLDDLDAQLRKLATALLERHPEDALAHMDQWLDNKKHAVERWQNMVHEVRSLQHQDFAMFSVALRELIDLAQISVFEPRDTLIR